MPGTTLTNSTTTVVLASYGAGNPFSVGSGVSIVIAGGSGTGIYGDDTQAWTLTNAGAIVGGAGDSPATGPIGNAGGLGVDLLGTSNTLNNTGFIAGGSGGYTIDRNSNPAEGAGGLGIFISGAAGSFSNSGTVTGGAGGEATNDQAAGSGGGGLAINGDGAVFSNAGTVAGGGAGIVINSFYYRPIGAIGGVGVSVAGNGDVLTNAAGALIEAGGSSGRVAASAGISLSGNNNSLINHGTIQAGAAGEYIGGTGIALAGSSNSIANYGVITGTAGGGYFPTSRYAKIIGFDGGLGIDASGMLALTNSGTISGGAGGFSYDNLGHAHGGGAGIRMAGGTVTNAASGVISGGIVGAIARYNYGGGSSGGDGVYASGTVSMTNAGTIDGGMGSAGAYGGSGGIGVAAGSLTITNSGEILGGVGNGASAVEVAGNASLINSGTIQGGAGLSNEYMGGNGGTGVSVGGALTLTNSGTIVGGAGVYNEYLGGNGGTGVSVGGTLTLTNKVGAVIEGGNFPQDSNGNGGVGVKLSAGTVSNAGTINGGAVGIDGGLLENTGGVGVVFTGSANSTLTNSGVISGGSGWGAVQFGGGDDRLILLSGSSLIGDVDGGTGTNEVELAASPAKGTFTGFGTAYTNFQKIAVDTGAMWAMTGKNLVTAGETVSVVGSLTANGSTEIDGKLSGSGKMLVSGGMTVLGAGAKMTVEQLTLFDTGVLAVRGTLTYAGTFGEGIGTTLSVAAGDTLTLKNAVYFAGVTSGQGSLVLAVGNANFALGSIFRVATLSLRAAASATVKGATSIVGNLVMAAGSKIVLSAARTLTLSGVVSGSGVFRIGAGAFLVAMNDVWSKTKIAFNANTGTLRLSDPAGFKAGISKFAAGDRIDIDSGSFAFSKAETATYVKGAGGTGTLTLKNGAHTVALNLFGQYRAQGFHLSGDGHGGTMITYEPPGAKIPDHLAAGGHG